MSNLIFHSLNDLPIGQRISDGYISATAMCEVAGKRWDNYFRLKSTEEYLSVLSTDLKLGLIEKNPFPHIGATALIQVFQGGDYSQQGTWVHPEVAVDLAKWLSPEFRMLVNRWVVQWMSGSHQQQSEPQSEPKKLPWTPPEKFPKMTEEEFNGLSPVDKWYVTESDEERNLRLQTERSEINTWLRRCYRR